MTDLTVLYYSASRIGPTFAQNVRQNILACIGDAVLVSVSHEPLNFGWNVCIGPRPPSTWLIYTQILTGALLATTPYVACAEDDCLYTPEHFAMRPSRMDVIAYNVNRWQIQHDCYFYRCRSSMCMAVAPRDYLVSALATRVARFPHDLTREEATGWAEPGRKEAELGLPPVNLETFETPTPTLTFNHRASLGGKRKVLRRDTVVTDLPPWGPAAEVWARVHGA